MLKFLSAPPKGEQAAYVIDRYEPHKSGCGKGDAHMHGTGALKRKLLLCTTLLRLRIEKERDDRQCRGQKTPLLPRARSPPASIVTKFAVDGARQYPPPPPHFLFLLWGAEIHLLTAMMQLMQMLSSFHLFSFFFSES